MFRIENNDPEAIIKDQCNFLYNMMNLRVEFLPSHRDALLTPTVKRWFVYSILLDKSLLKNTAMVLIKGLGQVEFSKLLIIFDDPILDLCQEEIFKEVCKLGKRQEELACLLHILSPERRNQFMQVALEDPVFCERIMLKILQSIMAMPDPELLVQCIDIDINENLKFFKGILRDPAEFYSFIKNFVTSREDVLVSIEEMISSDVVINIRFEVMRALLKHEKLDDVDRMACGSSLIVAPFVLMLIIKWLPEECIKKFFPKERDDFLFKKICGMALQTWTFIYPDNLLILLRMGVDPDARLSKKQPTLLSKIVLFAKCKSIATEKNNESMVVSDETTPEENETEEDVRDDIGIEEYNNSLIEIDKLIQSIPLLLSYGANPNFKIFMTGKGSFGLFSLVKIFMRSERMLVENCQPHDIDAALALIQYGASPTLENKNKQNILQIIYAKYPGVREYIRIQGISDKELEDPKSVFKKISIASFRREIQYVLSAQQVARSQYLNALILLANERHANREEKSILSNLPVEILIRILSLSDFRVMNKKPEEGLALLDFIFSHPNKVKKMVSQPGGVSVFQTADEEGKPQFTLFKSTKALAQDFVSLQRKLVPSQISKPISLFGKAKQKLKIKSHVVVQKLDSKAVASVSEEIELIQKTAPQHLQAELNFYKKPESRAFLLEKVNDAPWAREVKPFLA